MDKRGYLDGGEMATTFNMLRANDLIWSFVVNNYLLGKEPVPVRSAVLELPTPRACRRRMHSYYLRNMYQENLLIEPGGITLDGVPIDLRKIKTPDLYPVRRARTTSRRGSRTYRGTQLYRGPERFVLAGSGHIAGVVNPPRAKKYQHWLNGTGKNPPTLAEWQKGAVEHPGSWWNDWDKWLSEKSGAKVPARVPGEGGLPALEDAPGSYVKVRVMDEPS